MSHCSSINIVCKSGNLSGEHGIIAIEDSSAQENFILNSTIGYLFDRAVDTVTQIAAFKGVIGLFFGAADFSAGMGSKLAWEPLLYARSKVVHAAASAGLDVIDVPFLDLDDLDGMRVAAEQARMLGFSGKGSIHPKQIPILNEIFTPSADQISRARRTIAEFEKADTGLVVIDGKLIEKPVLREMYRIVSIADRMGL